MADERSRDKRSASGGRLPPWLRGVPLPSRPVAPAPPTVRSENNVSSSASAENTLPDWLRDLQGSLVGESDEPVGEETPQTTAGDEPDWLSRLSTSPAQVPATGETPPAPSTEQLPDWLQELSSSTDASASAPPSQQPPSTPPRAPEGATSWLHGLADTPSAEPPEPPPPPSRSSRPPMRMPRGATDWLRSLGEEPDPTVSRTNRESAEQASASPPAGQPSDEEAELPSWLTDISREEMERDLAELPSEEETAKGAGSAQRDLGFEAPSWLAPGDERDADRPSGAVPDWLVGADLPPLDEGGADADWMRDLGGPAESPSEPPSGDLPDWLRAAVDEQTVGGGSQEQTASNRENDTVVPDWLRGADEPSPAEPPVMPAPSNTQEQLPSWLRVDDIPSEAEPPAENNSVVADSDTMPDWLRDVDSSPTPSTSIDDTLPGWFIDTNREASGNNAIANPSPSEQETSSPTNESDVPDWLRGVEPGLPDVPASENDTPSWLRGVEAEPPTTSSDEGDVPDWLRGMDTEPSPPTAGNDVPDWLHGMDTEPALPPSAPESDVPDWLRGTDSEPPSPRTEPDAPDWLRAEEPAALQSDTSDQQYWQDTTDNRYDQPRSDAADVEPASDDVPPWLQHNTDDSFSSGSNNGGNLPAWLRGAESDLPPTTQASTSGSESPALPSWLQDEQDTFAPSVTSGADARPTPSTSGDFFGSTDLPGWLRPSESSGAVEAPRVPPPEPQPRDWLAQLRAQEEETEAAPSDVVSPVTIAPRPGFNRTPAQLEAVALLQRLIADPFPAPATAPAVEVPSFWQRVGAERLLYILLLIGMILGLTVPTFSAPLQGPVGVPNAQAIDDQISRLSENDVVLVAYEWDARRRSELSPLEQAVMQHLAQQKVKFVFVSTDLQGTVLSFDARDQLVNQFGYRPGGLDYILLGYKPGGELALRGLAQNLPGALSSDFQGANANASAVASDIATGAPRLNSLNDFAMVLVMADDPQDVQAWMEQVHTAVPSKPFVFLLPAETTPIVQPYLQQPGVLSLSGRNGALAYNQIRNAGATNAATAASGQLPFAIIVFVVLLLIGALVSAIFTASKRRKRTS